MRNLTITHQAMGNIWSLGENEILPNMKIISYPADKGQSVCACLFDKPLTFLY